MTSFNDVWGDEIAPLIVSAYQAPTFQAKRSALRKALALVLEHSTQFDHHTIGSQWQSDDCSWREHTTLTRTSASGLAACFGSCEALLLQCWIRWKAENGIHYNEADVNMCNAAMFHWELCLEGRGGKRKFGHHNTFTDELFNDCWADMKATYGLDDGPVEADEEPEPTSKPASTPSTAITDALDTLLASASMPSVAEIDAMRSDLGSLGTEVETLREKLASMPTVSVAAPISVTASGAIPSGTVTMKPAHEPFGITGKDASMFEMPVPVGEWDDVHPHVPVKDDDYVFDTETLIPTLLAITHGRIPWLKGHTGTGKTTLVEQVYARLQLPLFRLNLDSDITRGELVGREVLRTDADGHTVTEFVEGIIPMAMQQPCGLLLDEIDASRPDLGFVLQRLTEGKGFMLLEDGGRTIAPHQHFRMFATANTNGRGDETGLYSGTRALGTAFVNRFKPYLEVDYMSEDEEAQLIQEKVPAIDAKDARSIASYATEHRVAFKQADVTLACSPRDTLSFALAAVEYQRSFGDKSGFLKLAFKHSILNAADSDDRQVLEGLAERVFTAKTEG